MSPARSARTSGWATVLTPERASREAGRSTSRWPGVRLRRARRWRAGSPLRGRVPRSGRQSGGASRDRRERDRHPRSWRGCGCECSAVGSPVRRFCGEWCRHCVCGVGLKHRLLHVQRQLDVRRAVVKPAMAVSLVARRVATMATLTVRSRSQAFGRMRENPCKPPVSADRRDRTRTLAH
jgi:hypothetical protein